MALGHAEDGTFHEDATVNSRTLLKQLHVELHENRTLSIGIGHVGSKLLPTGLLPGPLLFSRTLRNRLKTIAENVTEARASPEDGRAADGG